MRNALVLAFAAALSAGAPAQSDKDHAAHHPDAASAPVAAATPKSVTPTSSQPDMSMKSMHDMHKKMMSAKTPDERQALMSEHMKAMQDGMATMGRMKSAGAKNGSPSERLDAMGKRMDMMEMMMQMMVDREAVHATPAK